MECFFCIKAGFRTNKNLLDNLHFRKNERFKAEKRSNELYIFEINKKFILIANNVDSEG